MHYTWFISFTECNFNYVLGCFLSSHKTVQRCAIAREAAEQKHSLVYKWATSHCFCMLYWLVCIYGTWFYFVQSLIWRITFVYVFRLIEQLPRANVVLLRYIFGVLHGIEMRSEENQMNAFNLAICIAPSLLWPPVSSTPDVESEFTKKVRDIAM